MNVLSNLPTWLYWAILLITFVGAHVLVYNPGAPARTPLVGTALRVGSSLILLLGLVLINTSDPGSILLALFAAALGGFLSGKGAPPPKTVPAATEPGEQGGDADTRD